MAPSSSADVVVIGAGVLGLSTAHHLVRRGAGRVMVLDSGSPASGTSGAGAGFVGRWAAGYLGFYGDDELLLEDYGIDFYTRLAETDPEINLRSNGSLYTAVSDDGLAAFVEPIVDHPLTPPGTRTLDPVEVEAITGGLLSTGSVTGGVIQPGGIQISAGRVTRALAHRVAADGVEIRTDSRALGLVVDGSRVTGVRTADGSVAAANVVVACGAWTNDVLADVDRHLPLLRMVATRVVSPASGVPATAPTVMVPDLYGLWVREHRGGLTWGNGDGYAPLFEIGGTAGDGGQPRREELIERLVANLGPELAKLIPGHDVSVGWWLQGMPVMTPDRMFILGPVPDVEGLFVLAGDNESGVTHGPGLGRLLADLVVDGDSSHGNTHRYRVDRFDSATPLDEAGVLAAMPARR